MKTSRSILLVTSSLVMVFLLGGGLLVKVGAADGSYRQAVLFAEILSQVLDNYVDPVEPDGLLEGAYEGMLSGLDPNGAFLSAPEVTEWKALTASQGDKTADPGITVLKAGRSLQVVSVLDGSSAADAGVVVGDQVHLIDGEPVRDLSLAQARYRIRGVPGSSVKIELIRPSDGFSRETVDLVRKTRAGRPYELSVEKGTAVLTLHDLHAVPFDELAAELDDVHSRPVSRLLIDLRNLAGCDPRDAAAIASLFTAPAPLQLRNRSGQLVETIEGDPVDPAWSGSIAVLVNGATAEGAEALTLLLGENADIRVFGEKTFGLGAEPSLYELQNGSALLLSSSLWETPDGKSWHESGIEPDEEIHGQGDDYAGVSADQLERVLDRMAGGEPAAAEPEREAA